MNSDMEHQRLVHELNKRARRKHMEELERHSTPFFYAILIAIAAITLWGIL